MRVHCGETERQCPERSSTVQLSRSNYTPARYQLRVWACPALRTISFAPSSCVLSQLLLKHLLLHNWCQGAAGAGRITLADVSARHSGHPAKAHRQRLPRAHRSPMLLNARAVQGRGAVPAASRQVRAAGPVSQLQLHIGAER